MRKLLDRIKEDVLILDKKGKIRYCNEKLGGKLHYHSKFMGGWDIEEIVADSEALKQLLIHTPIGEEIVLSLKTKEGCSLQYVCKVMKQEWEDLPALVLVGKVQENYPVPNVSMRQILEQIPCSVLIKGLDGRYSYSNQNANQKCGITKEMVIGKTDCEVWGAERGKVIEEEDLILLRTQETKEVGLWRELQERKFFKVYKFPFYQEKQLAGIIKICKDETLDCLLEYQQDKNDEELLRLGESKYRGEGIFHQDFHEMKIEQCLIRELQAQGVSVLAYEREKNQLISYFYEGVCKTIMQQDGLRCVPAENLRELMHNEAYQGVHPVMEHMLIKDPDKFLARGIKDIGMYPICYQQEFMGVLMILYESYDYTLGQIQKLDERIGKQLAVILKQFERSRKLKEELLRRKLIEEELGHLLDTAADLIKVVDKQGKIQMVSQSFCELVGKSKEEIIGRDYKELIHEERNWLTCEGSGKHIFHYTTPGNKEIWLEWHVRYNTEKDMYVCIGTDITKAKELAQQQEDYERRVQKEIVKNEFFTKISHEFRTPINMVLSSLELIKQIEVDEEVRDLLGQMRRKGYRLLELVDDLIDMTEIDAGFAQLQLAEYNIVEVIESLTEAVIKRIKLKKIDLIFDTQIEEQQMRCDRTKIERAIGSVIINAVNRIVCEGAIRVEVKFTTHQVKIYVTDNGRSTEEEEFVIAQSFVGMHGGSVFVQVASDGENTTCLELPLKVEGDQI